MGEDKKFVGQRPEKRGHNSAYDDFDFIRKSYTIFKTDFNRITMKFNLKFE